ncbi:hypothetical protein BYT27DRAFT_7245029 [Phlegmacium glaucopus]|nr:hypothetical protein BYT27DRAFT_7245029 [Phlegmacium glaucopus]
MSRLQSTISDMPIATVYAWSDSEDGDGVGTPYMLLDWIEGRVLEWNESFPTPVAREKVLVQYSVDLLIELGVMPISTRSFLANPRLKIVESTPICVIVVEKHGSILGDCQSFRIQEYPGLSIARPRSCGSTLGDSNTAALCQELLTKESKLGRDSGTGGVGAESVFVPEPGMPKKREIQLVMENLE